jgi:signal transduction histidine kinase
LGASPPLNIIVLPVLFEGSVRAVVELASFSAFSPTHQAFLDQLPESIGLVLNTIEGNTLTENLLKQSQSLAEELRSQQEELRSSNEDLGRQATLLAEQNIEAEHRNQQIELGEEKAGQLSISSKYKSEFIANMSHELRTPLNSLLILAEQLQANPEHNMTDTQVEYASVIRASGNDLLSLLNSILELAKVESGTVTVEMTDLSIAALRNTLVRDFEHVAQGKGVAYSVDVSDGAPSGLVTDPQRLQQILKNLLANAFKFTEDGEVQVQIGVARQGWNPEIASLATAPSVLAIAVTDTGIGIEQQQQQRIFEAFAQADGTTARRYGGTGLGLSISRELVGLLGGEITVSSRPEQGSTFTVYLPLGLSPTLVMTPIASGGRTTSRSLAVVEPPVYAIDEGSLAGIKILVVDDDFRNLFAMNALLERGRADVSVAENGAEALAALEAKPDIEIVLMDIMMPGMDGYDTIRAIRAIERFVSLPIIAVTGKVVQGERQRCLNAGANDYIPKPVETAQLIAALTPWLTRS